MRSSRTRRWLAGHRADPGVRAAKAAGWRSRSAIKLIELDRRERILRAGARTLDLGAAPGGWSQVASQRGCRIAAVDLLPIDPLAGVDILQGDFTDPDVRAQLAAMLGGGANAILCDAAPDLAGVRAADDAACIRLHDAAIACVSELGAASASLVAKTFAGEPQQHLLQEARRLFERAAVRKPATSRPASAECYVVAHGLRRH